MVGKLPTDLEVWNAAMTKLKKDLTKKQIKQYLAMLEHDANSWVDCVRWLRSKGGTNEND